MSVDSFINRFQNLDMFQRNAARAILLHLFRALGSAGNNIYRVPTARHIILYLVFYRYFVPTGLNPYK
jgi:hypothetical protein